jgi:FkbM family methyltransferase
MTLEDVRQQFLLGRLTKHEYIRRMHELHARVFEYPAFIRDADIGSITISPDGVILQTRDAGVRLEIDSVDERLIPIEITNFGSYETDETAMFLRLAEGIDVVFDIGANIGWFSLNTAIRYGSSADIYAFAPIPTTYGQLVRNIELNDAQSIHPNNFGFSDESSPKTFFYYPHGSGNASTADLSGRDDVEEIMCSVRTVDEYTRETGMLPGLIKCDVEGAELFVFKGGTETIGKALPIVFTEMLRKWAQHFGYSPNDIIDWFAALGYRCFTVQGPRLTHFGRMDDETAETNFFFLHEEKHASRIVELAG